MAYRFVEPCMAPAPEGVEMPSIAMWPGVQTCQALDAQVCRQLADRVVAAHQAGQSWPSRTRYATPSKWGVDKAFRRSRNLSPQLDGLQPAYDALDAAAVEAALPFGVGDAARRLQRVDEQCLVYEAGDYLGDHADNSALDDAEGAQPRWQLIKPERHFVAVMWLTSQVPTGGSAHEFSGGTLRFNSLVDTTTGAPLDVCPQAGTLAFFPASPWYRHEVLPVVAGTRVAVTRWYRLLPQ